MGGTGGRRVSFICIKDKEDWMMEVESWKGRRVI